MLRTVWANAVKESKVLESVAAVLDVPVRGFDVQCIVASIQRYVFLYCSKEKSAVRAEAEGEHGESNNKQGVPPVSVRGGRGRGSGRGGTRVGRGKLPAKPRKRISFEVDTNEEELVEEPDWGLRLIASGCIGDMMNLLKRNKAKDPGRLRLHYINDLALIHSITQYFIQY